MIPEGVNILLVEDEEDDVIVTKRAFKQCVMQHRLCVASDGQQALEQLGIGGGETVSDKRMPQLILLDLNMDRMDGFEFLKILRSNDKHKGIPVIILSSSERQKDINRAYELGANNYIVKPVDVHEFKKVVSQIEEYWFVVSKIPKKETEMSS